MRKFAFVLAIVLSACAPAAPDIRPQYTLHAYSTGTLPATPTANVLIAAVPRFTATPIQYVIQAGDTLSQLAETYRVAQDDLLAANPGINPNALTIGSTILIPSGSSAAAGASTPTPAPVNISQAACHATADRALWCFALIQNNTADDVEGVSVQITLRDASGADLGSEIAYTPLNILRAASSLPAFAYFAQAPANANPQFQLLSALVVLAGDTRYLAATLSDANVQIAGDRRLAQISGSVRLPAESKAATQVWVAAVASDATGQVIGLRRWDGAALQPGANMDFDFEISAVGGEIVTVQLFVEAR